MCVCVCVCVLYRATEDRQGDHFHGAHAHAHAHAHARAQTHTHTQTHSTVRHRPTKVIERHRGHFDGHFADAALNGGLLPEILISQCPGAFTTTVGMTFQNMFQVVMGVCVCV